MTDENMHPPTDPPITTDVSSGFAVLVKDENGKRSLGLTTIVAMGPAGDTSVTVWMSPEKSAKLRDSLERGEIRCRSGLEVVTNGHVPPALNRETRRHRGT